MKKNILLAGLLLLVVLMPNKVFALSNDEIINIIATDGKNAVFKMKQPTSEKEAKANLNNYVNYVLQNYGYFADIICDSETYSKCDLNIYSSDYESSYDVNLKDYVTKKGWTSKYAINVTYDAPKENANINKIIENITGLPEEWDRNDVPKYYILSDLSLINYQYNYSKYLYNFGATKIALKYSSLNNFLYGTNIEVYLDLVTGEDDSENMVSFGFGPMSIFYGGYLYATKNEGIYLRRLLYIPEDTPDTPEDYVKAAQKRINDYLKNDFVKVTYGGKIADIRPNEEDDFIPIKTDGNYYVIHFGDDMFMFYIVKGNAEQLKAPVYLSSDINTNIEVETNDSSVPLDTIIKVKDVTSEFTKEMIGTDNFVSYDIKLYSNSLAAHVEKLDSGMFVVKIPIPEMLNGKKLIVYYFDKDNNKISYDVTIKNGFAEFNTNHFSVYTLAEYKENVNEIVENPSTSDNILLYFTLSLLSVVGMVIVSKKIINN